MSASGTPAARSAADGPAARSAPQEAADAGSDGAAARARGIKHSVTARTKARRRAVEILFEADQRGLLRPDHSRAADYGEHGDYDDYDGHGDYDGRDEARNARPDESEAAEALRDLAAERAERSANHTPAPAYAREILAGVADHLAEVDEAIETYAQGWALARMPAVDRAIARVATWEIVWNDDVDAPVAVDEAMTLARMLSTDDSPRYLGGLLGRIGDLADTLR
ncbi:antitermination protein NusB [Actinomyces sp. oral taxon 414]|uniref:transcription antitermination factor NusB n=1 Tax=Actinomyces sp. oral taxon 414 TaxID=712122 RepID=UPI0006B04E83|nr:antitermination protein NusB [Actinomyces sp. oral taxon 414]